MAVYCPYCDSNITDDVINAWADRYSEHFEFKCPKCDGEIDISVEMTPEFVTTKRKERAGDED